MKKLPLLLLWSASAFLPLCVKAIGVMEGEEKQEEGPNRNQETKANTLSAEWKATKKAAEKMPAPLGSTTEVISKTSVVIEEASNLLKEGPLPSFKESIENEEHESEKDFSDPTLLDQEIEQAQKIFSFLKKNTISKQELEETYPQWTFRYKELLDFQGKNSREESQQKLRKLIKITAAVMEILECYKFNEVTRSEIPTSPMAMKGLRSAQKSSLAKPFHTTIQKTLQDMQINPASEQEFLALEQLRKKEGSPTTGHWENKEGTPISVEQMEKGEASLEKKGVPSFARSTMKGPLPEFQLKPAPSSVLKDAAIKEAPSIAVEEAISVVKDRAKTNKELFQFSSPEIFPTIYPQMREGAKEALEAVRMIPRDHPEALKILKTVADTFYQNALVVNLIETQLLDKARKQNSQSGHHFLNQKEKDAHQFALSLLSGSIAMLDSKNRGAKLVALQARAMDPEVDQAARIHDEARKSLIDFRKGNTYSPEKYKELPIVKHLEATYKEWKQLREEQKKKAATAPTNDPAEVWDFTFQCLERTLQASDDLMRRLNQETKEEALETLR